MAPRPATDVSGCLLVNGAELVSRAQRRRAAGRRDGSVEAYLHAQVCHSLHLASHHAGTATSYLPLARAQQLIGANWTTAKTLATRYLVKA